MESVAIPQKNDVVNNCRNNGTNCGNCQPLTNVVRNIGNINELFQLRSKILGCRGLIYLLRVHRIKLLKTVPFGKRMVRAGFKPLTYEDLMDRLGCTAVNERNEKQAKRKAQYIAFVANKKQEEKRLKSFFKIKRKPYSAHWYINDEDEEYYSPCKKIGLDSLYDWIPKGTLPPTTKGKFVKEFTWKEYEVVFEKLEDYSESKIPLRCLKNVALAINLGARYLWVAKPELKVPDPIIVATRENVIYDEDNENEIPYGPYYEIDMWK